MQAIHRGNGEVVDYTPGSAVSAGDVIVLGSFIGIALTAIAAGALGALRVCGLFSIAKVTGAVTAGQRLYWDADGNPVSGTAGTGAVSTDASVGPLIGYASVAATSGAATVDVILNESPQQDRLSNEIADPGDGEAIPVTATGSVSLVTTGAETRTLAAPTFVGQQLNIGFKTDGGDCVITCATGVNQTGNNTLTAADAGDLIGLVAVRSGANLRWRVAHNDGVALTTV
jgi:predicted RecA/RadA family phage recombinase